MEDSSWTAQKELHCSIHAMSPVKKANSLNRKYFDCTLQNKDNSVRAVRFSPEKYAELNTLQQTKSPVKITNYNTSANNGKGDIILLSKTRITPITSNDIDFPYSGELTAATEFFQTFWLLKNLQENILSLSKHTLCRCLHEKHCAHNIRVSSKNKNYSSEIQLLQ